MHYFSFVLSIDKGTKFNLLRKIGRGQPKVLIYINFAVLESQMLSP